MDVELTLPPGPVRLTPGAEVRVPVEVHNRSPEPVAVRVGVAGGRVAGWTSVEPPDLAVPADGSAQAELVFRPPERQPTGTALIPFTVRADEMAGGERAGWVTGLLNVSTPDVVTGSLEPAAEGAHRFALRVANSSGDDAAVRIAVVLDPPAGQAVAEPAEVTVPAGGVATATVRVRPRKALWGAPRPYTVVAALHDAARPGDAAPLTRLTGTATNRPWISARTAGVAGTALLIILTAVIVVFADRVPLPGAAKRPAASPSTPSAAIRRPFVLVEVFPHSGADGGYGAAEAARTRLADAGMPTRLVDSLTSDQLADDQGGFWVLLQDGFESTAQAQAYCDRFRSVAPKCRPAP
jgi:hypothetical protein